MKRVTDHSRPAWGEQKCQPRGKLQLADGATSHLLHFFFPFIQKENCSQFLWFLYCFWFLSALPIQARSTNSTPIFYLSPFLPSPPLFTEVLMHKQGGCLFIPLGTGGQKLCPVLRPRLRRNHQCCQTDCAGNGQVLLPLTSLQIPGGRTFHKELVTKSHPQSVRQPAVPKPPWLHLKNTK